MITRPRIAVIGVGNEFRRDDGVGWAVVGRLREDFAVLSSFADVALAVCDGDPVRLIGLWEGADLAVVVDAAHAHPASPGRVHRLELDSGTAGRPSSTSSHGLGLGEAVELARILGRLPTRLIVYAVEGVDSTYGPGLSPAVAAAVEPVAGSIEGEILRHGGAAGRGGGGGGESSGTGSEPAGGDDRP
ncbi:hydrogenase maturation protease [Streptomyces sp. NPDC021093]|uniref:hydrogenase maturation protease n=1 Tax=Streptomyces sp. NPDC021093 TaxID=3365112 RepID=UPI003795D84C